MAGWFLLVGIVVVFACGLLGAAGVRRAFRPLREVEAVATAFGDGDTTRRVTALPPTTEVGRLGRSVNAMLDRIETSLAAREASEGRMRRFVADASHELRTPLAAVRGFAELHRIGAVRDPDDVAVAFGRIETEAVRMGGLVEDLLLLARLDEQRPMAAEPVDLLLLAADRPAVIRGGATDDVALSAVQVAVKDRATNQWWNPGSATWGSQVWLDSMLTTPGGTSSDWSYAFDDSARPGSGGYYVAVRAKDLSGKTQPSFGQRFDIDESEMD